MDIYFWAVFVVVGLFCLIILLKVYCRKMCNTPESECARTEPSNMQAPPPQPGFIIGNQRLPQRPLPVIMPMPSAAFGDVSSQLEHVSRHNPYPPPQSLSNIVYPPATGINPSRNDDLPPSYEVATGQQSTAFSNFHRR